MTGVAVPSYDGWLLRDGRHLEHELAHVVELIEQRRLEEQRHHVAEHLAEVATALTERTTIQQTTSNARHAIDSVQGATRSTRHREAPIASQSI